MYTEKEVLEFVQTEDVKFIRLAFFDVLGRQKNISIMANELHRAFTSGIAFDASSICGFESVEKSDLFLFPDPSTISILPWRPSTGKVVRIFCDIKRPDGSAYEKDCRQLLKTAVQRLKDECNIRLLFGPEMEFYLFKADEMGHFTPFDNGGYMDVAPEDKGENIRREICFTLEQMGIHPEASHHEDGPGQNEVDFKYSDALTAADNASTFKWIVRTTANSNGLYASFSPKPLEKGSGSGFHINISAQSLDKDDKTDYLPYMIAGIFKHIKEITLFLNPTELSYERLGSCKAPDFISWGRENRSQLIRIPAATEEGQRLELRSADPMANPYIVFTLLIYSIMDGIKNRLQVQPEVTENLFDEKFCDTSGGYGLLPKYKGIAKNLEKLPFSIEEAYENASGSDFVKQILGGDFAETIYRYKNCYPSRINMP